MRPRHLEGVTQKLASLVGALNSVRTHHTNARNMEHRVRLVGVRRQERLALGRIRGRLDLLN